MYKPRVYEQQITVCCRSKKNIISYFASFWFQIKAMLSLGYKAEIQALSSISFEFLTDTYLPVKIKHGRWI